MQMEVMRKTIELWLFRRQEQLLILRKHQEVQLALIKTIKQLTVAHFHLQADNPNIINKKQLIVKIELERRPLQIQDQELCLFRQKETMTKISELRMLMVIFHQTMIRMKIKKQRHLLAKVLLSLQRKRKTGP